MKKENTVVLIHYGETSVRTSLLPISQRNIYSWLKIHFAQISFIPIYVKKSNMLAIFHKACARPPKELDSPASHKGLKNPKLPQETLRDFLSLHPSDTFSMTFEDAAVLAYNHHQRYGTHHSFYSFEFNTRRINVL